MPYSGPERRQSLHFSETQLDQLAEKAADKAVEKLTGQVYHQVGKGVVQKALWLIGAMAVGVIIWFKEHASH